MFHVDRSTTRTPLLRAVEWVGAAPAAGVTARLSLPLRAHFACPPHRVLMSTELGDGSGVASTPRPMRRSFPPRRITTPGRATEPVARSAGNDEADAFVHAGTEAGSVCRHPYAVHASGSNESDCPAVTFGFPTGVVAGRFPLRPQLTQIVAFWHPFIPAYFVTVTAVRSVAVRSVPPSSSGCLRIRPLTPPPAAIQAWAVRRVVVWRNRGGKRRAVAVAARAFDGRADGWLRGRGFT